MDKEIWEFNEYDLEDLVRIKEAIDTLEGLGIDITSDTMKRELKEEIYRQEEERFRKEIERNIEED